MSPQHQSSRQRLMAAITGGEPDHLISAVAFDQGQAIAAEHDDHDVANLESGTPWSAEGYWEETH